MGRNLAPWTGLLILLTVVAGCEQQAGQPGAASSTGESASTESEGQIVPTSNQGASDVASARRGDEDSGRSLRRESVEVEPYEGPPIFLEETSEPVPATVVEKQRTVTQTYPDGGKYIERQVTRYSDDRIVNDGSYHEYFRNGQLFVEGQFVEGDRHGDWTYWHENGQKNRVVTYENGVPEGSWEVFREDGTLEARREFKDGKRHGEWIVYNDAGDEPRQVMQFTEGEPDGTWKEWYPSGVQKGVYEFKAGQRHGLATEWDEDGNMRAKARYKNGKLHGEVNKWDMDGKKYTQVYDEGRLVRETVE